MLIKGLQEFAFLQPYFYYLGGQSMSQIKVSNLTFGYSNSYENIFENTSFQIDTNWKLGFIGRNGRGKTTFLNLLCGKYEYSGTISSTVNFEYFPFNVRDKSKDTIEIIDSICSDYLNWELLRELTVLDVSEEVLNRPFNTLSHGEQTKTLLASLFLKENSFLLIDEPTNHLDLTGRELIGNYLNKKKGFILVSHDRNLLDNCVDHVLSINKTNIEIQQGNFSSWYMNKERQDLFEIAENEKLKGEIERLKKSAKKAAGWSDSLEKTKRGTRNAGLRPDTGYIGHKSAKMMKRSKVIESRQETALEEKSKLLKNLETSAPLKLVYLSYHTSRLVSLDNVSIFYGDKKVCTNINFNIEKGDRIALCGTNGSGKSSIINIILGENISHTGNIQVGSNLIISHVAQDTTKLKGNLSDFAKECNIDESIFKSLLRKLDFSRDQFDKAMESYSDGQKKKVLIAKSLSQRAHLYIWDEPLNFIDVLSRIQIEELLLEFKPTILFVEHDSIFCDTISTKRILL